MNKHSQTDNAPVRHPQPEKPSIGSCLAQAGSGRLDAPPALWGFGGLHGGLALAAIVARIQATEPAGSVRSISGQFLRPIRGASVIEVTPGGEGASLSSYSTRVQAEEQTVATATVLFGVARRHVVHAIAPAAPPVPSWEACEVLRVPRELVPVAAQTEIRPVGMGRPFAGGSEPELTAWIRLAGDDTPPDVLRLIFLLDALAPSYSAILRSPQPIPTVEMSAHLTQQQASSPWILLSARTDGLTTDGWITEHLDAWDMRGQHLAHARQLRVIQRQKGQ